MTTNPPRRITEEELRLRFAHHPPRNEDDAAVHADVRREIHNAAITLVAVMPPGREASVVITKLEEAMMWANAAIARARGADPAARIP